MKKRPHIIIFNPDEMSASTMGHMGNPAARTPFLDRFAATDAVSFQNAYCQNPVCVPSRCSFFTGLYPHVNGHRTMSYLLHPGETSLLKELKDAGYYVWMNDRNDLTAGQIPNWTESHASEIHYTDQTKVGPGPIVPNYRGEPGSKHYYSHMGGQLALGEQGQNYNTDDEIVDAAIHRIRNRPKDQPLCMFLGLMYPHPTYQIEEPYYSAIDRSKLPERIKPEQCSGKSKILDLIRQYANMQEYTEADWDELRSIYLAMCSKIDYQFEKLVQALKDEGIYDDCAIFFFSDHGDFAGEYGLVEKAQNSFEDCLTNVPFLIKPPAWETLDAGTSESLVELVDFYGTAMAMAGVTPAHSHFGKDLRPVLADRRVSVRDFACCEGGRNPGELHCDEYSCVGEPARSPSVPYWPKKMAQRDDTAHAKGIMLRDARFKYVSRTLGEDELYDLESDPGETTNRIHDPLLAPQLVRMREQMLKWLQATADVVPYELDTRMTTEMMWHKICHLVPPEQEQEVRKMLENALTLNDVWEYCKTLRK